MTIHVEETKQACGIYRADYLRQIGYTTFLYTGGMYIAVKRRTKQKVRNVVIHKTTDEPLWRQAMHMQMGQMPRKVTNTMCYTAQEVPENMVLQYSYYPYDEIRG